MSKQEIVDAHKNMGEAVKVLRNALQRVFIPGSKWSYGIKPGHLIEVVVKEVTPSNHLKVENPLTGGIYLLSYHNFLKYSDKGEFKNG